MAAILPFSAVLPPPERAASVAAPPYDVVSTPEARTLAGDNPLSFLRVSRPEIELPDGISPYDDRVYERAAANYRRLRNLAPLAPDSAPRFYVYSLVMAGRRQTGVVGVSAVDDYDAGVIRTHEKTRQSKEDDRTRHVDALSAQTGPVFLTCRDSDTIGQIMDAARQCPALFDFIAPDGITHQVWRVADNQTASLQRAFAALPTTYIADGHHRAKSASRVRQLRRAANPQHTGDEAYNRFLTVIFPAGELQILAYNRVVHDLNGQAPEALLNAARAHFDVQETKDPIPAGPGHIHMFVGERWYRLVVRVDRSRLNPADALDVAILQDNLLAPALAIADPRTSTRIDFVGGIRGTAELERRVRAQGDGVAFSMCPVTVEQLMAIADAGLSMPPKSTWFEPKLRDGLLIHEI